MAGLNMRLMLTVDMEAENAWNKLIAIKSRNNSVYKVRSLKPVLYDSLEPIETCTAWAKNTKRYLTALNVMFHKIIFCLQKLCLISMLLFWESALL